MYSGGIVSHFDKHLNVACSLSIYYLWWCWYCFDKFCTFIEKVRLSSLCL